MRHDQAACCHLVRRHRGLCRQPDVIQGHEHAPRPCGHMAAPSTRIVAQPCRNTASPADAASPAPRRRQRVTARPDAMNRSAIFTRPSFAAIAPPATPTSAVVPSATAAIVGRAVRRRLNITIHVLVQLEADAPFWTRMMGAACFEHYIRAIFPAGAAMPRARLFPPETSPCRPTISSAGDRPHARGPPCPLARR